jgi:hypothetical protein
MTHLTTAPTNTGPFSKRKTKWVVLGIIIIIVVLVVPVIPVQKTIMVAGTTATTVTYQTTGFQTVSSVSPRSFSVYQGNIVYVPQAYYNLYYIWYSQCYVGFYSATYCGYNYSPYSTPSYTTTVAISPSQNIVNVVTTPGSYGLSTVTITDLNGTATTYINVFSNSLTQSGTSTTQTTTTIVTTITQNTSSVTNIVCQSCVPQQVTIYVSILQLLTGNY